MIQKPKTNCKDVTKTVLNEWVNLENIVKEKLIPLCEHEGYDQGRVLLDYLEHYSLLNHKYNCANKRYLSGDVVANDVSVKNQDLALDYIENKYFRLRLIDERSGGYGDNNY